MTVKNAFVINFKSLQNNTRVFESCTNHTLKGYSGVSLIHDLTHRETVLTHRETVLDSLSRDQVSRPLIYEVLSTSEMTARQQYTAVTDPNINRHQKATNNAQNSTKLQQQYK